MLKILIYILGAFGGIFSIIYLTYMLKIDHDYNKEIKKQKQKEERFIELQQNLRKLGLLK